MCWADWSEGWLLPAQFLKALAPPPLTPDATASLYAIGQEQSIDQIFDTLVAAKPGRWRSIYVHQSLTASGSALTLAHADGLPDHFLIGNGDPITDGALQTGPRWNQQKPPGSVPGVELSDGCISICVVGDFDQNRPSLTQQARLVELISALQRQLSISSNHVYFGMDSPENSVAGIGGQFPVSAIRSQILP